MILKPSASASDSAEQRRVGPESDREGSLTVRGEPYRGLTPRGVAATRRCCSEQRQLATVAKRSAHRRCAANGVTTAQAEAEAEVAHRLCCCSAERREQVDYP